MVFSLRLNFALSLVAMLVITTASAAELTVVATTGPLPAVVGAIIPIFDKATGHKVTIKYIFEPELANHLKEIGDADVVIAEPAVIDAIAKGGAFGGERIPIMISKIGIATRAGAPKPDIGTPEKLKAALIAAKSIAYNAGPSGRHFVTVADGLGLADVLKSKAVIVRGEPVGAVVARGAAELGVQQVAELLPIPDTEFVGPLPGNLQMQIPFSAGIQARTKNLEAAKAFAVFFTSPAVVTVMKSKGVDPI